MASADVANTLWKKIKIGKLVIYIYIFISGKKLCADRPTNFLQYRQRFIDNIHVDNFKTESIN